METKINLITIWTDNIIQMKEFYNKVLGFEIKMDLGNYVEFENEGVRLAICMRIVMYDYNDEFRKKCNGQVLELAFPCKYETDVDNSYNELISKGAKPIKEPENMPWGQRAAFFADPDGNIHEVFAELV